MWIVFAFITIFTVFTYFFFKNKSETYYFKIDIIQFLEKNVAFYNKLSESDRKRFVDKMQTFLSKVQITGVNTELNEEDKALIAAGAVIPIFQFDHWFYPNLKEVLLYPQGFDENFNSKSQHISGMVGNRFLNGKMLLSKRALYHGFSNKTDKFNTAIHEFVHLIDMADGATDGIPEILINQSYTLPWIDLMYRKIKEIKEGKSDINPYGATSEVEFLSVAAEYFFERPDLLKKKHPQLFELLNKKFRAF